MVKIQSIQNRETTKGRKKNIENMVLMTLSESIEHILAKVIRLVMLTRQ
jgi:hypothetical protein